MAAKLVGGTRSWDTDHDILVVVWSSVTLDGSESGSELLGLSRKGLVGLASVEVKNLTNPTFAMIEAYLRKNAMKMRRDKITGQNALVLKRKGGRGQATPYLLIMELDVLPLEGNDNYRTKEQYEKESLQ